MAQVILPNFAKMFDEPKPSLRNPNNRGFTPAGPNFVETLGAVMAPNDGSEAMYQKSESERMRGRGLETQAFGMKEPGAVAPAFRTADLIVPLLALLFGDKAPQVLAGGLQAKMQKAQADTEYGVRNFQMGQNRLMSQAKEAYGAADDYRRSGDTIVRDQGQTLRNREDEAASMARTLALIAGRDKANTDDNAAAAERARIKGTLDERKLRLGALSRAANNQSLDPSVRETFGRQVAQMLTDDPELVEAMAASMGKPSAANINATTGVKRQAAAESLSEKRGRMIDKQIGVFDVREADRVKLFEKRLADIEADNVRADAYNSRAEKNASGLTPRDQAVRLGKLMADARATANTIRGEVKSLSYQFTQAKNAEIKATDEDKKKLHRAEQTRIDGLIKAKELAIKHYQNLYAQARDAKVTYNSSDTAKPMAIDPKTGKEKPDKGFNPTVKPARGGLEITNIRVSG